MWWSRGSEGEGGIGCGLPRRRLLLRAVL
jgi:hypothetical protein